MEVRPLGPVSALIISLKFTLLMSPPLLHAPIAKEQGRNRGAGREVGRGANQERRSGEFLN
jgi:hypothetical protein